jgi:hypothetical protein
MSGRPTIRNPNANWRLGLVGVAASVGLISLRAEDPPPAPAAADPAAKYQIDKDRRIFAGIKDDERVLSEAENNDEFLSYNEVFEFANQFRAPELEAHARRDVSYRDLMGQTRDEFKLDLVYLEGRLARVLRREPTPTLAAAGIPAVYEGWLFPKDEAEPVCIVFSELPPEITPAKDLNPVTKVQFAGYVFKVIRYEAQPTAANPARGTMRRAPLLIGKSVTVVPTAARSPGADWQGTFVPGLLIGLGVLSAVGFGLAWWYRRGDRSVRTALAGRARQNPFAGS